MDRLALIFDKPAEAWNEALPLGNGTMGAMSYGRFQNERIELNLDSLWSGNGRNKENPNKNVDWDLFRKHIFAGDYQGAENYCKENVLGDWTESYLPAGTLSINVKEPIQNGNSFYRRELCLTNATEKIEFCQDDLIYQREFFVSMSEPVMAIHYHTSPNCNLEMSITLESEIKHKSAFFAENGIILEGQAPIYVAPPYYSCEVPVVYEEGQGIRFAIGLYVQTNGGNVYQQPKRYTSGSMILAMENAGQLIEDEELRAQIKGSGIGTSATRAEILKKLVSIKYLSLNQKTQVITPSLLGEMVYEVVDHSIRQLLNPELTASWEKGLTYVAEGSITSDEYMEKLERFVAMRTVNVTRLNNQYDMRGLFDAAAAFYKTKKEN